MQSYKIGNSGMSAQPDPRNLLMRIQALEEQFKKTQQRCDDLETELMREKWHRQELQWQLQENGTGRNGKMGIEHLLLQKAEKEKLDEQQTVVKELKQQVETLSFQMQSETKEVSGQLNAVSSLLNVALASEVCKPHKRSPLHCLHCAIKSGTKLAAFIMDQSEQVEAILQCYNENGESPLLATIKSGELEMVKLLAERSSSVNLALTVLGTGQNALHYAASFGHTEVLKYLLELNRTPRFDVNALDNEQQTPLFLACRRGHLEVVKILVDKDADPTMRRNDGCTPLHAASFYGHHDVVQWLLQQEETSFMVDYEGNSALHYAALGGHVSLMELLVKNGLSLARTNFHGQSALEMANTPQSR